MGTKHIEGIIMTADSLRRGSIIRDNKTGERYQVTTVFHINKSVHCLKFYDDGTLHPQRNVQGFTFKQIEKFMTIEGR